MKSKYPYIGLVTLLVIGMIGFCLHYNHKQDPYLKIAEEIYRVETALKEIDGEYACRSIFKVTPFSYTDSEGNRIVYYCCQTRYIENESGRYTGLNMDAIRLAVDLDLMEEKESCQVNQFEAFCGELDNKSYLCWTLSPEMSCVIEYDTGKIPYADILRMAESVQMK